MNGETVEGLIQKAYNSLKESDAGQALLLLQDAMKLDYEHPEVLFCMKCVNWWLERMNRLEELETSFEKGGFILNQWKSFHSFRERIGSGESGEACVYALRRWVFSKALASFSDVLGEGIQDPEVLFQIGRCYKGAGDYEEAARHLEQAAGIKREDAGVLAELADINALLGDSRAAKVLFREAFFLDAQGVELDALESEMIVRLVKKVAELGYEAGELAEWIPVYGTLWGVFSIKRELKPVELGKLKQSILALEGELRNGEKSSFLKPRLLNRYFRLIDYYEDSKKKGNQNPGGAGEDPAAEIMVKIKFIDEAVYEQYRN